ncbi:hypothetical protein [Bosea sp. BK604]|uniref:hypothetical protein n=1 Tax=Bosea sp. BK604 TaxID=2512180 RepID=UPI00104AAC09|nr:hypothetical protein [Bosea sp. BK604]TCR62254.1 hypothetical protein EV560_111245 [Bosea sp. BK604]
MKTLIVVIWCLTLAGCAVADREPALSALGPSDIGSQQRTADFVDSPEDIDIGKPTTTCTMKNGTAICF